MDHESSLECRLGRVGDGNEERRGEIGYVSKVRLCLKQGDAKAARPVRTSQI